MIQIWFIKSVAIGHVLNSAPCDFAGSWESEMPPLSGLALDPIAVDFYFSCTTIIFLRATEVLSEPT